MSFETINVRLTRNNPKIPWGYSVNRAPNGDIFVSSVEVNSMAEKSGIKQGDILQEFYDAPIQKNANLSSINGRVQSSNEVTMVLKRFVTEMPKMQWNLRDGANNEIIVDHMDENGRVIGHSDQNTPGYITSFKIDGPVYDPQNLYQTTNISRSNYSSSGYGSMPRSTGQSFIQNIQNAPAHLQNAPVTQQTQNQSNWTNGNVRRQYETSRTYTNNEKSNHPGFCQIQKIPGQNQFSQNQGWVATNGNIMGRRDISMPARVPQNTSASTAERQTINDQSNWTNGNVRRQYETTRINSGGERSDQSGFGQNQLSQNQGWGAANGNIVGRRDVSMPSRVPQNTGSYTMERQSVNGVQRNTKPGPPQVQAQVPAQVYNDSSRGRSNVIKPYNADSHYNAQMQHQSAPLNAPVQQNVQNLAKYPPGQIPGATNYSQPITVDTSHWYGSGQYPGDSPGHYGNYGGASAPMSAYEYAEDWKGDSQHWGECARVYYTRYSPRTYRELSPEATIMHLTHHLQYNSPLNLYSPLAATEAYRQQTGKELHIECPPPVQSGQRPAYMDSATRRLIMEEEAGMGRHLHPSPQSASFKRLAQAVGTPID
ncbi:PDZ domain [Ditylenchus destructor]|nr:PDZ domain [Ditylenchus destructor]